MGYNYDEKSSIPSCGFKTRSFRLYLTVWTFQIKVGISNSFCICLPKFIYSYFHVVFITFEKKFIIPIIFSICLCCWCYSLTLLINFNYPSYETKNCQCLLYVYYSANKFKCCWVFFFVFFFSFHLMFIQTKYVTTNKTFILKVVILFSVFPLEFLHFS